MATSLGSRTNARSPSFACRPTAPSPQRQLSRDGAAPRRTVPLAADGALPVLKLERDKPAPPPSAPRAMQASLSRVTGWALEAAAPVRRVGGKPVVVAALAMVVGIAGTTFLLRRASQPHTDGAFATSAPAPVSAAVLLRRDEPTVEPGRSSAAVPAKAITVFDSRSEAARSPSSEATASVPPVVSPGVGGRTETAAKAPPTAKAKPRAKPSAPAVGKPAASPQRSKASKGDGRKVSRPVSKAHRAVPSRVVHTHDA
jgi:hypothetical protein